MKTQLIAVPKSGLKINGKIAQPYVLQNTKSVRGLKAWLRLLKFRHGETVSGISKVDSESGEQISFHPIS